MNTKKTETEKILGIDIGGLSIKLAAADCRAGRLIQEPLKIPTPQPATPAAMISDICRAVAKLNWNGPLGCGFPGVIKNGMVRTAANLHPDWLGVNLRDELSSTLRLPVVVLNDADAAALAEMRFGAGKSRNQPGGGVVLVITLGTGIGSALFVDGHLLPNTEVGHAEMDGRDAEKWAATVAREREGLDWPEWGARVNRFLHYMEKLFSPDLIIIGGGVSANPEKFFPYLSPAAELRAAEMGNDAGILGAALGRANNTFK